MPYVCEYCNQCFYSQANLRRHKTTAIYCLDIQNKTCAIAKVVDFKCKCGSHFTRKDNLDRHEKICITITQNNPIINNAPIAVQNITNITNNITINNAQSFTMATLTKDYIIETLTPLITKEIAKQGIGAITEIIVDMLMQKDGKYCYYCTDKSRKQFRMLIDHEGQIYP